jgi:hypothetical protein
MGNKKCYVVNFYLGERRKTVHEYKNDKLFFLKKQIEKLHQVKHSINTIIFNFNIRVEDYFLVSEIFKLTPKFIQGSKVEINIRENYGMSYAAWSDIFMKYQSKYDYYIFNEDDYFFVEDNWDDYLVKKFESFTNCGYLCMVSREGQDWCNFKKHAGHATGISSFRILNQVVQKYGELPHSKKGDYHSVEQEGQINQSNSVIELGYDIYDVRDDYQVNFAMTDCEYEIWKFFSWNTKEIIKPALIVDGKGYSYWESFDDEFKPYNNNLK